MACSAKEEQKLVKRVQFCRRQVERWGKAPKSQLRSKKLIVWRRKRSEAEVKLAKCREVQLPRVRRLALNLMEHKWSRFVFSSPTGGTAKVALRELYANGGARCAATGAWRKGDSNTERLLDMLIAACDVARGPLLCNCILNGSHRSGSLHYEFRAVDIDKSSAITAGELQAVCARHGCGYLNEDSYHWHCYSGPGGP